MSGTEFGRAAVALWVASMTVAWVAVAAAPVRAQQASAGAQPTPEQIKLGESIFTGKTAGGPCWGCHGKNAKGTANAPDLTSGKWLDSDGTWEDIEKTITTGVAKPKKFSVPMPPMGGAKLTPEQVKAVAAYVYSLSHKAGKG